MRQPAISQEFAEQYGYQIESIEQYCQRTFLSKSAVRHRIIRRRIYGYKQGGRWHIVVRKVTFEDLKFIIV